MPAVPSEPRLCLVDDSDPLLGELADVPAAPDGLLELVAQIPDPRKSRGKRHGLAGVLGIALAARLAGARSFVAIAEWAADATPSMLAALGVSGPAPSESTIRRCLQLLAPDEMYALIGAWMWLRTSTRGGRRVIAFDGKTLRGARNGAGRPTHLLAGLCQHSGTVLAQLAVDVPTLRTVLRSLDITGAVVTADALHCQRETATVITAAGGHYILTVKANQPTLHADLKAFLEPDPGLRPQHRAPPPRPHHQPNTEGLQHRCRNRLPRRRAGSQNDPHHNLRQNRQALHRNRLRDHLPISH